MNRLLFVGITIAMGTGYFSATTSAQTPAPETQATAPATQAPSTTLEQGPPDHPATPSPSKPEPQQFLAAAKQLLDAVPTNSLGKDAQKKLAQLRDGFKNLVANYQTQSSPAVPTATDTAKATADWKTKFDEVERDLTSILGGGASLSSTSTTAVGTGGVVTSASAAQPAGGEPSTGTGSTAPPVPATGAPSAPATASSPTQPVGSSGTGNVTAQGATVAALGGVAVEEIGVKNLDPGIRRQLEQVRRNIELFYDAGTQTLGNP